MSSDDSDEIETMSPEVYARRRLALDPDGAIAIKRDVRSIVVGATTADLIGALHAALRAPGAMFGHIRIVRARDRLGLPFTVGERFQGRYSLAHALAPGAARAPAIRRALSFVEDRLLSDYAVITRLDLDPRSGAEVSGFSYDYLEGTPIAGRLTMECRAEGPRVCRVTQTTEYQERDLGALLAFGTRVLRMHNQVFHDEIAAAAARLGAAILYTDIPGVRTAPPPTKAVSERADAQASAPVILG